MILGATDQKLWMFEVFRRSLGKACVGTNEKGLTTCAQKWGLEFEKKVAVHKRRGLCHGRLLAVAQALIDCKTSNFMQFFILFY
jgi:hypothetical protein